ncbi:uncharacterized protein LOC107619231 [Arachis ipaensis]|uniref:uncharacterized protein LOC107619231 n=1 Tax=Arachis ipaensis TaxID=130454 RepID=UPI0007AFD18A|nr:uncharacterized protein LOC107619231 [Arachis ipaensis]XP_025676310.1 uncharacterized protein LOC112776377 [Arachis hypogaea]
MLFYVWCVSTWNKGLVVLGKLFWLLSKSVSQSCLLSASNDTYRCCLGSDSGLVSFLPCSSRKHLHGCASHVSPLPASNFPSNKAQYEGTLPPRSLLTLCAIEHILGEKLGLPQSSKVGTEDNNSASTPRDRALPSGIHTRTIGAHRGASK